MCNDQTSVLVAGSVGAMGIGAFLGRVALVGLGAGVWTSAGAVVAGAVLQPQALGEADLLDGLSTVLAALVVTVFFGGLVGLVLGSPVAALVYGALLALRQWVFKAMSGQLASAVAALVATVICIMIVMPMATLGAVSIPDGRLLGVTAALGAASLCFFFVVSKQFLAAYPPYP